MYDGERVLSETTWLAGREHSSRLLVEVDAALERIGKAPADLTGLVVARGPGSFTGVRVALSVAKGMAAALSVPLWGVGSLDVLAGAAACVDLPVRAVLEAGRGRYATALFRAGVCVEPPQTQLLDELARSLDKPTLVIGELNAEARVRVAEHPAVQLAPLAASLRRAGFLAELGWLAAQAGDPGDARAVDALYLPPRS